MRAILGFGLAVALALAAGAAADDKKDAPIDGKKLVGKWSPKDLPKGFSVVVEFAKDGKATMTFDAGDKKETIEGKYKLDGNKLVLTKTENGKDESKSVTVTKLTNDALVTKDEKDKETTLERVK